MPLQGLMLLGVGGFGLFMTCFSFATLFPDRQGTILSVFNGAFDCGVVWFGALTLLGLTHNSRRRLWPLTILQALRR